MIRLIILTRKKNPEILDAENRQKFLSDNIKNEEVELIFHYVDFKCKSKELIEDLAKLSYADSIDSIIVLYQSALAPKTVTKYHKKLFSRIFFFKTFDEIDSSFNEKLLCCLHNILALKNAISGSNYLRFILPLRNFCSKHLSNVENYLLSDQIIKMDFDNNVMRPLSRITTKPKKKSPKSSFVDERNVYFTIQEAPHGIIRDQLNDGHNYLCKLASIYRFGLKIKFINRHFDVDKDKNTHIKLNLINCHDQTECLTNTHFNIFPNDYIR